ncbi:MAG: hypothetical protein KAS72_06015 [Phycisphaerales bacterium]|nr:hypothetical protein [Phycisphaerales bacterium]
MRRNIITTGSKAGLVIALAGLATTYLAGNASAQTFSLDDNPTQPLVSPAVPPLKGAEDPYGQNLPATMAGLMPPSPSLIVGPFFDGDLLLPGAGVPWYDIGTPWVYYLDAVTGNHWDDDQPPFHEEVLLRFSVARETTGLPGSASLVEAMLEQQPGDIYETEAWFLHPIHFVGTLGPGPFAGFLPTVGTGGLNILYIDESQLMLTAGNGVGNLRPPGVPCPPIMPGTHDNVDAFNEFPLPTLDVDGDMITDCDFYFSTPPAEWFLQGFVPAHIYDVPAGQPGFPAGAPPYAWSWQMGLDSLYQGEEGEDNIDSLVVWDLGARLGPAWGGPGAEPAMDFALFTLSPGSASLMVLGLSPGTVFFTDFTGAFAVYALEVDLGLDSRFTIEWANVDALEVFQKFGNICVGDLDGDGDTDQSDLGILLGAYGTSGAGDLDGDGDTDQSDLGILLGDYGCVP